jgi:hypothetical protein
MQVKVEEKKDFVVKCVSHRSLRSGVKWDDPDFVNRPFYATYATKVLLVTLI